VQRSAISASSFGEFRARTQSHTETVDQAGVVDTEGSEIAIRRPPRAFFVELGDNNADHMQSQLSEDEDDDHVSSANGSVTIQVADKS
jgi:hypothetical protein